MSISDPDVIDLIGQDRVTDRIILTISDHLSWTEDPSHFSALQRKVGTYLGFIESGQLLEQYPGAQGRMPEIRVVGKFPLTDPAVGVIDAIRQAVEKRGIGFSHTVLVCED